MREIRLSGSEGGGASNVLSLPLYPGVRTPCSHVRPELSEIGLVGNCKGFSPVTKDSLDAGFYRPRKESLFGGARL